MCAVVMLAGCDSAAETSGPTQPRPPPSAVAAAGTVVPADVASAAASQVTPERPRLVALPSGAVMAVDAAGSDKRGVLLIPADIDRAGWWTGGSRLGDPYGSMVVAAHVDSFAQGLGPIVELLSARPGARITVSGRRLSQRFRIGSVRLVERASLGRLSKVFSPRGDLRLVLITCGGPYDAAHGGYRDNLVVVAAPDGPMRRR